MTNYLYDLEHVCGGSVVNLVRYHTSSQALYVQTNGGQWYRYVNVPKRIYDLLDAYTSYGAWWNQEVKAARFGSTNLYAPQFKEEAPAKASYENETWENSVDSKWSIVVEFSEPLTFTVRGDDVLDAVESVNSMLTKGGFDGKYKVREVKKQ